MRAKKSRSRLEKGVKPGQEGEAGGSEQKVTKNRARALQFADEKVVKASKGPDYTKLPQSGNFEKVWLDVRQGQEKKQRRMVEDTANGLFSLLKFSSKRSSADGLLMEVTSFLHEHGIMTEDVKQSIAAWSILREEEKLTTVQILVKDNIAQTGKLPKFWRWIGPLEYSRVTEEDVGSIVYSTSEKVASNSSAGGSEPLEGPEQAA